MSTGERSGEKYRMVAEVYDEALDAGDSAPTKAVAVALDINFAAARNLVARVRRAGLLPETRRGVVMGSEGRERPSTKVWRLAERLGVDPEECRRAIVEVCDGDIRIES